MPAKATIALGIGLTLIGAALKVFLDSESALVAFVVGVVLLAYAILVSITGSHLEIIFDAKNPARRFWSVESFLGENDDKKTLDVFWEYRVEIKNKSSKTVKNVSVTTEHTGQIPIRQVGMLAGDTALEYGPIKVTVSGDDTKPATRVFSFNYQEEPMMRA